MSEFDAMEPHQLRAIRLRLGLTQAEFGILMGYARSAARKRIGELENGHRRIPPIRALRARQLNQEEIPPREIRLATKIEGKK